MARGGYRKPTNPAPVSGPGSLSQRTDGGPGDPTMATQPAQYVSGLPWGQGQELLNTQQSADLAAAPDIEQTRMPQGTASAAATQSMVPLNAPTQMPDVPVTDGVDAGEGRGMAALGLPSQEITNYTTAKDMITSLASNPNSSPQLKYLAQQIGRQY